MNEFIVWDSKEEEFVDNIYRAEIGVIREFVVNSNGKLSVRDTTSVPKHNSVFDYKYKTFNYIGKTDIEGNKIYADSSIVEFTHEFFGSEDIHTGYFTYDSEICCYYIETITGKLKINHYLHDQRIEYLKIIGTLQENKDLL